MLQSTNKFAAYCFVFSPYERFAIQSTAIGTISTSTSKANWDIGYVHPPLLKEYIDQLTSKDIAILIPGCGHGYEAEYLLQQGFTQYHPRRHLSTTYAKTGCQVQPIPGSSA